MNQLKGHVTLKTKSHLHLLSMNCHFMHQSSIILRVLSQYACFLPASVSFCVGAPVPHQSENFYPEPHQSHELDPVPEMKLKTGSKSKMHSDICTLLHPV